MTVSAKDALTHFRIQFETPPDSSPADAVRDALWADEAMDGQISEYTPPVIATRSLDWPTHTDGLQIVDGGLEDMESTLVSLRYTGEFLRLHGATIKLTCYNALRSGQTVNRLRHELTGLVTIVDLGTVTTGTTPPALTLTMNVDKFKSIQNTIAADGVVGADIVLTDIDVDNRKRQFGTVDRLAGIKAALGVG